MMGAQEDHQKFSELADELGYDGKQRDTFINDAMEHKGHVSKSVWEDAPPGRTGAGDGGEGDFFQNRKAARDKAKADAAAAGGAGATGATGASGDSGKGGNWQGYGS